MIQYHEGFLYTKAVQRPCKETGRSTRSFLYGDCRRIYLRNGETDAWARNPLVGKKPIVPNAWAISSPLFRAIMAENGFSNR